MTAEGLLYVIQSHSLARPDWHVIAHASTPEKAWQDERVVTCTTPVRLMIVRWKEPVRMSERTYPFKITDATTELALGVYEGANADDAVDAMYRSEWTTLEAEAKERGMTAELLRRSLRVEIADGAP